MRKQPRPVVSDHLHAFGLVIYNYAMAERTIKHMLGAMLNLSLPDLHILTNPYNAVDLRLVTVGLIRSTYPATPAGDRIISLVDEFSAFSPLRNHIAHDSWDDGARPGSIKPLRLKLTPKAAKVLGVEEEEKDYLPSDLMDVAAKIYEVDQSLGDILIRQPWTLQRLAEAEAKKHPRTGL